MLDFRRPKDADVQRSDPLQERDVTARLETPKGPAPLHYSLLYLEQRRSGASGSRINLRPAGDTVRVADGPQLID